MDLWFNEWVFRPEMQFHLCFCSHEGVNSLAACILAITGIVVSVLGESSETLAIIDDLVGVIVSFFIASYGT